MRFRNLLPLLVTALICGTVFVPSTSRAQWTNRAPKLLGADPEFGAIAFKGGTAWAGLNQVYVSIDSGKSWTIVDLVLAAGELVTDIECYDATSAIVTTTDGAHLTLDRGASFTHFFKGYQLRSAVFGSSVNQFVLADAVPDHILSTTDGGATWKDYAPSANGMMVRMCGDGTLLSLNGDPAGDHISVSSDFGNDWTENASTVDFDCYNFVVDPCHDSTLYVMNEQVYQLSDHLAKLYTSTDRGSTWTTNSSQPVPYYSGAMAITPAAFYLGTTGGGILRSTNEAANWMEIGGPRSAADSRSLVAIDENTLLAISPDDGSIWFTPNSGGTRVYAWSGSTPLGVFNFFDGRSNAFCGSIDSELYLVVASCTNIGSVRLLSDSIQGSSNFTITDSRILPRTLGQFDSIQIHYASSGPTLDTGRLHLRYSIDSLIHDTTILLVENGDSPRSARSNSVGTLHVQVSNPVDVPIGVTLSPALKIGTISVDSISFSIAYNSNLIDMISSKAKSLVSPRSGWTVSTATVGNGLLGVTIVNSSKEMLSADSLYLATARFTSFQSAFKSTTVQFASIEIYSDTSTIKLCTGTEGDYIANVAVDNSGVAITQVGASIISVFPNPASPEDALHVQLQLDSSAFVGVWLLDILGRTLFTRSLGVLPAGLAEFPLEAALLPGTYYLRVETSGVASTKKIVVR